MTQNETRVGTGPEGNDFELNLTEGFLTLKGEKRHEQQETEKGEQSTASR